MVNSFLDAVTTQLGKTFGTDYRYYVEDVQQKLTTPCFTVDMLMPLERSRSPLLYDRTMPLVIHYFSDDKQNLKRDCYDIAEQVLECVEYLPYKNTVLRGEDISWQIVDGVLQIFVTYKFTTMRVTELMDVFDALDTNVGTTNNSPIDVREFARLGVGVLGILKLNKF